MVVYLRVIIGGTEGGKTQNKCRKTNPVDSLTINVKTPLPQKIWFKDLNRCNRILITGNMKNNKKHCALPIKIIIHEINPILKLMNPRNSSIIHV